MKFPESLEYDYPKQKKTLREAVKELHAIENEHVNKIDDPIKFLEELNSD